MKRVAALLLLLMLVGCTNQTPAVTVFAASSLTSPFENLAPDERFNFAGSDELAAQIREGAPADVFASASPKYTDGLLEDGLIEEAQVFATNSLVVIVPPDNPAGIDDVSDLTEDGVKVVIADAGVPAGDYARTVLDTLGLNAALDNVVSEEQDVKGVVAKVSIGEADAGFAYITDVAGNDLGTIRLPEEAQPDITYTIAAVTGAGDDAREFVDLVLGSEGREVLETAGFGLP